ncbi:hypothetical protein NIES208_00865 [[Limnothrix rosea] IAM M-220]|nr:hypothetical protein NIES208_00865 [[Limnothrix rosea] IAM M-220]
MKFKTLRSVIIESSHNQAVFMSKLLNIRVNRNEIFSGFKFEKKFAEILFKSILFVVFLMFVILLCRFYIG